MTAPWRLYVRAPDGSWEARAEGTQDHVTGVAVRRGAAWTLLDPSGRHARGQYHARIVGPDDEVPA